ncbi:YvcK family protein, partial [Candidatus Saccharibacteria bacterium]|nr:YvcK family protein [Candidatus Saccharibacteria bacterium]
TLDQTNLVAEYDESLEVVGEHEIDEPAHDGRLNIRRVYLLPKAKAYPPAVRAIKAADLVIIGPGDLFTSILPPLVVEGIGEALRKSKAKKLYILNLMNRYGQTYGFTASRFLSVLGNYLGGLSFNYVLVNNAPLPREVLRDYALVERSFPVEDDLRDEPWVIRGDLLSRKVVEPHPGDKLKRSLLRHDPVKLAKTIVSLPLDNHL